MYKLSKTGQLCHKLSTFKIGSREYANVLIPLDLPTKSGYHAISQVVKINNLSKV